MSGPASAQDLSRADPFLRFLWQNRDRAEAPAARAARVQPRAGATPVVTPGPFEAVLEWSPAGPRVRTLVRVGPGGEGALRRAGAIIGARAGDIVTARIPLDALPSVLAEGSIQAIEAATPLRPLALVPGRRPAPGVAAAPGALINDSANADAGFDRLRRRVGDRWEGLAGQGVIVGVYDSGLDLAHEDFRRPDGTTRVLFAWDQTEAGTPPGVVGGQPFDYGAECGARLIEAGDCPMVDRVGHGTHVAGTAAGDGSATGREQPAWRFPGGAPAADLVVVKGGDGVFTPDRLVEGIVYIFARAQELGRPAVVNVSLSAQSGPHDGTTLLEEALDALVGPGRIIVSGTGNEGNHQNTIPPVTNGPYHAEGRAATAPRTHGLRVPPYAPTPGAENDAALLELWYDGTDSLAITVRSPGGLQVTAVTGDTVLLETPEGAIVLSNAPDGPAPGNGDHGAVIGIVDTDESLPPDSGLWAIEVAPVAIHEGGGGYHLWLTGATFLSGAGQGARLEGGTTNRYLVGVPASADRVLATGAHVTRHTWVGVDGPETFEIREALGDIAYFSSPGPRRDGVIKPDVTAPGKMVISSLSKDATLWDDFPRLIEADSVHVALLGTSTSAPQLAAAVAILLQLEPALTPEQARDALRLSAAEDAFVEDVLPDPAWGAGKLDAAAAAERIRPDGLGGPERTVALSANPVRSDALVISYDEAPRSIAIYTLIAERVRSFEGRDIGALTTVWGLDTDRGGAVANGAYVLVVEFPDRRVVRKILVARP